MSEKFFPLETKHFIIRPEDEKDLLGKEWSVCLRDNDQTKVGALNFAGAFVNNEATIGVKLEQDYDKAGNYAEIFFIVAKSLFRFTDVKEVHTECRYEEEHLMKGIEKADFVYRETIDGNRYYSMKKQKTVWTGVYILIGFIAGFFMGIVFSNLWLGTISGLVIGIIIGVLMDKKMETV